VKEIKPSDVNYDITATGIETIMANRPDLDMPVYNLSGQKLTAPKKGINIIGGKKVVVK
jgi:hypothetical protein